MALFLGLTLLAAVSSAVLATRLYPESRAERALAALVILVAMLQLAMQALGWSRHLSRGPLALSVTLASLAALAAGLVGRDLRERVVRAARSLRELAALPWTAVREAWTSRSPLVVVGLIGTFGVVAWTTWLAYLAESGGWDGLWYHETMAYLAIQMHGFATPALPPYLALAEGLPRTSENLMLWATIFSGRTLVDSVGTLTLPMALVGTYVLVRQHVRGRMLALGLAIVLATTPAAILQLRSTYVDLTVLAAFVAAAHFATKRGAGVRDAWMAALAIGFLSGTKANQVAFGALLGAYAVVRLLVLVVRRRSGWPLLHGVVAGAVCLAMFAPSYVHNWHAHRNPIWPLKYESKLLHLELDGPYDIQDMQWPADQLLADWYGLPAPGQDYYDTRHHAYGYGLMYLGVPLVLLALLLAMRRFARGLFAGDSHAVGEALHLLFLILLGAAVLKASPAIYWARFALGGVAVLLVPIGWVLDGRARALSGEAPVGAMIFVNLLTLYWAQPAWEVPVADAVQLARMPLPERRYGPASPCSFGPHMRQLREERIGPGDVIVFDDSMTFPGNCWNQDVSNRALWVPFANTVQYLEELDRVHAKWVSVVEWREEYRALQTAPTRWHLLGVAQYDVRIFERGPAAGPAAATPTAPSPLRPAPGRIER